MHNEMIQKWLQTYLAYLLNIYHLYNINQWIVSILLFSNFLQPNLICLLHHKLPQHSAKHFFVLLKPHSYYIWDLLWAKQLKNVPILIFKLLHIDLTIVLQRESDDSLQFCNQACLHPLKSLHLHKNFPRVLISEAWSHFIILLALLEVD